MQSLGEFDFVVVGAGSAGCVVAARLCESRKYSVALIEAGGEATSFWIHTPLGYGKLYDSPEFNWMYEGEPEPELSGHHSYQPRGKVLGGTGSINGSIYMRGCAEDFDHWSQLGNTGWSYDDVLPYFKKCEDNERGASRYHGTGGPLRVSNTPRHVLADAFIEAGVQAGFARTDDFNGAKFEGFTYNQVTIREGRRESTASAYLTPLRTRANLRIILKAFASRVLFENGVAKGVTFEQAGEMKTVSARKEVIVSGGAFNSPQLLQLSGIGGADTLRAQGIAVLADRRGVGQNLQDHLNVSLSYRCTKPITLNDIVNNPIRRYAAGIQYILFRKGIMASNASLVGGCIKTDPRFSAADAKLNLQLWDRSGFGRSKSNVGLTPGSAFSTNVMLLRPESTGTVLIKSPDFKTHPEIRFNLFSTEEDRRATLAALKAMRKVMSMPAMKPYVVEEMVPGKDTVTDEELLAFARRQARSSHHPCGTCKMGVDEEAVVDPRLRVHGVKQLRVIDASVMPRVVSGNTNASTIMIGEKGAAMILEDAG